MTSSLRLTLFTLCLLGVTLTLYVLLYPSPAQAAAKVVGSGTAGSCNETTLRTALAGGGDITFNCSASPSPIVLTAEIVITTATTIDGTNGGSPVTISSGGVIRVFNLKPGVSLSLVNLTILEGTVPQSDGGRQRATLR